MVEKGSGKYESTTYSCSIKPKHSGNDVLQLKVYPDILDNDLLTPLGFNQSWYWLIIWLNDGHVSTIESKLKYALNIVT